MSNTGNGYPGRSGDLPSVDLQKLNNALTKVVVIASTGMDGFESITFESYVRSLVNRAGYAAIIEGAAHSIDLVIDLENDEYPRSPEKRLALVQDGFVLGIFAMLRMLDEEAPATEESVVEYLVNVSKNPPTGTNAASITELADEVIDRFPSVASQGGAHRLLHGMWIGLAGVLPMIEQEVNPTYHYAA